MRDGFRATPDDVSVRLITGQVARLLPRTNPDKRTTGGRRRPHVPPQTDQTTLKSIADIIDTLEAKHKIDLVESGSAEPAKLEDPTSTESEKLRLDLMTEFLVMTMHKVKKEGDNPEQILWDVAKVMHVESEIDQVSMKPDLL